MKRNAPPELWYKCDPFFAALDICGYSYQTGNYLTDHERLPDRIMYSAEIDPRNSFDNWMKTIDNEFIIGNFEWTAMDFMGEVGLGWFGVQTPPSTFPWNSTYSGDMDLCGFKRPRSYYRDILFGIGAKVSVFVKSPVPSFEGSGNSRWGWDDVKASWTWPGFENQQLQVDVYSSCDSVGLSLNGKTLGIKPTTRENEFKASWQVPYKPGTLKAIGYHDNKISETSELQTAGRPYRVRLTPDREIIKADRQDLCFITAEILDKNNILVPNADNTINFQVKGSGVIAAVGNGNPVSLESYQQPFRKAYEGKCLLIIKSKDSAGPIEVSASGKGILADKIIIKSAR
jgi:beta-galactosidase